MYFREMIELIKRFFSIPHFFYIFGGLLVAQFFNLFNLLLLPKFYTPDDFALFGVFSSFVFILLEIMTLKFDIAIQVAEKDKRLALTQLSFYITIFISIILLVCIVIYSLISGHYVYILLPIILFAYGINQSIVGWLNTEKLNNIITQYRILIVITNFIVAVACMYFYKLHIGLIIGFVTSQWVALFFLMVRTQNLLNNFISIEESKILFRDFFQFPKHGVLSSLINSISKNSIIPILVHFFGTTLGGLYTMSSRILAVPSGLYQTAMSQVFLQQVPNINKEKTKQLSIQILSFGFLIGILPSLLILFYGENIFTYFFGNEWTSSGKIASYIVLWFFINAIINPINLLLDIYRKLNVELIWNIILFFIRLLCLAIGYIFDSFWLAITLVSLVSILMSLVLLLYAFKLIK